MMTLPKKTLTHEAPARRELVPGDVDFDLLEHLRWNADRTAVEAVYVRRSVIAARAQFWDAVQCVAPEALASLLQTKGDSAAIEAWQEHWNLTAEWCDYVALRTATAYTELPPFFLHDEWLASRPFKPLPAPKLPAFDPTLETWADYEERCRLLLVKYQERSLDCSGEHSRHCRSLGGTSQNS